MDDGPQPPLEYRNPADEVPRVYPSLWVLGGVICGITTPALAGLLLFMLRNPPVFSETPHPPFRFWPETLLFATAAFGSLIGVVRLTVKRRPRYFLGGFLLGLIVMCSIEGTCFFNPR